MFTSHSPFFNVPSLSVVATVTALLAAAPAAAALDGSTVGLDAFFPDTATLESSAGTAVVGPGVEFGASALLGYPLSFDLSDTAISISYFGSDTDFRSADFNGFRFTFLGDVPVGAASNVASTFAPVDISLIGNALWLNYADVIVPNGTVSIIDLTFNDAVIPEPATWALMIAGFGLVGAAARRKAAATA